MDQESSQGQALPSFEFTADSGTDAGSLFDFERVSLQNFPLGTHAESNAIRLREIMGEFELVRATLDDAINIYRRYALAKGRRAQRLFREIDEWLAADDWSWPFSFVNICAILDLDPDYIRTGLKMWRERALANNRAAA
jgi:hypothetical protein